MGHNATVIVMVDALHDIRGDKDFGKKLADAILESNESPRDVCAGNFVNAATAIEMHHANDTCLVAVGGNYATSFGLYCGRDHSSRNNIIGILRELAKRLGYRISKIPQKKK